MMTESLRQFVLVGESAGSNAAVKQVKVVAAAPPPTPSGTLTVTIHVMQDTTAALACELEWPWEDREWQIGRAKAKFLSV